MAKEKFDRSKPHVTSAPSVTLTTVRHPYRCYHDCFGKERSVGTPSFDSIDNAPEEKERGITINTFAR